MRLHLLHARSADADAIPLVLTHGWPGSIIEFLDAIPLLREHCHVVVVSMPGCGFSGPIRERGVDVAKVAAAVADVMARHAPRHAGLHRPTDRQPDALLATGDAVYPGEILQTPRVWAEKRCNLVHYTHHERGGHFAAFEQPASFAVDLNAHAGVRRELAVV